MNDRFGDRHLLGRFPDFVNSKKTPRTVRWFLKEPVAASQLIRTPRRKVIAAMTTADGLDSWLTENAEIDLQNGGVLSLPRWNRRIAGEVSENTGTVVEVSLPSRLVFRWYANSGDYLTRVMMNFDVTLQGTVVGIVESGFEDSAIGLNDLVTHAAEWGETLVKLRTYLEHGIRL